MIYWVDVPSTIPSLLPFFIQHDVSSYRNYNILFQFTNYWCYDGNKMTVESVSRRVPLNTHAQFAARLLPQKNRAAAAPRVTKRSFTYSRCSDRRRCFRLESRTRIEKTRSLAATSCRRIQTFNPTFTKSTTIQPCGPAPMSSIRTTSWTRTVH